MGCKVEAREIHTIEVDGKVIMNLPGHNDVDLILGRERESPREQGVEDHCQCFHDSESPYHAHL